MFQSQTLIGFGASTMSGSRDSQGGFFKRIQPPILAKRAGVTFLNHGIGGNTTRDMLARCEKTEAVGPHDVIVVLGCNDMPRAGDQNPCIRTTLAEYEQNLAALLPRIKGESSLFVSSYPVSVEKAGVAVDTFDQYMAAARRIAADSGYTIWDLYAELRDQDLSPLWDPDGVHFNDTGHQLIADGVIARIS